MSEVHHESPPFLTLYDQGRVTAEQIDDFVGAWHESGDDEPRSLAEFLGLTESEYDVWFMAPRALPVILAARRASRPLREFISPFFETLKSRNDPADKPILHALAYWLEHHPAAE